MKRQVGGKESLVYSDARTQGRGEGKSPVQRPAAPTDQQGQELLSGEGGLHAETAVT